MTSVIIILILAIWYFSGRHWEDNPVNTDICGNKWENPYYKPKRRKKGDEGYSPYFDE